MRKNAFTLVEVLGVIILLGLVSAITVPVVKTTLEESKKKVLNKQINTIIESTKNWGIKNIDKLPEKDNGAILIKTDTLKEAGFLENKKIVNPVNKEEINACVEIKYSNSFNQYEYNYREDCTFSNNLITSSNDCINKSDLCENGTSVTVKVNNTTNYTFYIIKDTGNELTLIMDRNIGTDVVWINQEDYISAGGIELEYGSYGNSSEGPLTALNYLEEQTSGWNNIPQMSYNLNDDGGGNQYGTIIRNNVKARMLTYTEAKDLYVNSKLPSYLYTNLNNISTDNIPSSYWLSSSCEFDTNIVWTAYNNGTVIDDYINTNKDFGVRPVIELVKPIIY